MAVLTAQQEAFAQELAKGTAQAEAYRRSYPNWKGADKTLWSRASELAAKGKIKVRVDEIRGPVLEKVRYEYRDAIREAEDARKRAEAKGNVAAEVSAVQLKAKLSGLLVEDRKNDRDPFSEFDAAQTDAALDAVRQVIKKAKETA